MSLGKKFIRNSFFNVAGWLWNVLLSIATIPYIVHKLGYDAYGVLSLVFMVLGYFAFLDLGIGEAVIKYFSKYHVLKDFDKMNRVVNSILFLFILIGIIGALGIIIFTEFFAFRIFKIPLLLIPDARFCFLLSAVGFILNLIFGVMAKIPMAIQRFDVSNRNNIIIGTLVSLGNVILLALGFGLKQVVVLNLLGEVLGIVLFYRASKMLVPELRISLCFSFKDIKEVMSFGALTLMTQFSGLLINTAGQLAIGMMTGTAGVTIYSVPFKIISRFGSFMGRLSYSIFPMSSELNAKQDNTTLHRVYLRLAKYSFIFASVFFIPLAGFSREILTYWMGAEFAAKGHIVMFLCCLSYYFFTLTSVTGLVAMGMGKLKINMAFSFITAFINLATIYPMMKLWGVNGAAGSLLLSSVQVPFAIACNNKFVIGVNPWHYFRVVYGRMIFIYFGCLLGVKLMAPFFGANIGMALLGVFCAYGLLILCSWQWGLDAEDRMKLSLKFSDVRAKTFGADA